MAKKNTDAAQHIPVVNAEAGAYASLARLSPGLYPFNGTLASIVTQTSMGNAILSWESSAQLDLAVDLGLLNNRFNVTVD